MLKASKPMVEVEVGEKILGYKWKAPILEKKLFYRLDKCFGCGLCEVVCPVGAIFMGPVKEIASGRVEAPYVMIDETKCVVCTLCSSICPSGALEFKYRSELEYPKVRGRIEVDTKKCIPCLLCEKICPRKAIKVEVSLKKKNELVKYVKEGESWGKGNISIDVKKCCYCGLCELLCDAIKIEWAKPRPPDFRPGLSVTIDKTECDYCGLCERVCPVGAIKVECIESAPREIKEPAIEGTIKISEDCIWCGLCSSFCPVNAIKVEKPFDGEVFMVEPNECDPSGCKNCINVCPINIVYVSKPPSKSKMLFAKNYCIFCGACEKACPVNAIRVIRKNMRLEGLSSLWFNMNIEYLNRVLVGYKPPKPSIYHRAVRVEETLTVPQPSASMPQTPKGFSTLVEKVERLMKLLSGTAERLMFENSKIDELLLKLRGEKLD
ncbi:MAG: 4Fe-4S binding protein [Candidatus Nezhaarchaeales archaeon]